MRVQYQVIIEMPRNLVRLKCDISFRDHKFIFSAATDKDTLRLFFYPPFALGLGEIPPDF